MVEGLVGSVGSPALVGLAMQRREASKLQFYKILFKILYFTNRFVELLLADRRDHSPQIRLLIRVVTEGIAHLGLELESESELRLGLEGGSSRG